MSVDISFIDKSNRDYAIYLATFKNILTYKNGYYKIEDISSKKNHFEAVDFWRNLSLAAEVLLKACLLKHHVTFLKKRANSEYGEKVTANSNKWLSESLKGLKIDYVAQINTGTISTALRYAEKDLFTKIKIDDDKIKLITKMFYLIIRTRRNRNSHFFFPNQSHIEIAEVEMIFIPLLNMLEEIYRIEP